MLRNLLFIISVHLRKLRYCNLVPMNIEFYSTRNMIVSLENQNLYNVNITSRGFLMIFFLIMQIEDWFRFGWKCGSETVI